MNLHFSARNIIMESNRLLQVTAEQPAASLSAQDGGVAKIEEMGEVGYRIIST